MKKWIWICGLCWALFGPDYDLLANPCKQGPPPECVDKYKPVGCGWELNIQNNQFLCIQFINGARQCSIKTKGSCCPGCTSCSAGSGSSGGGTGGGGSGSGSGGGRRSTGGDATPSKAKVDFQFDLGKMAGSDQSAGQLSISISGPGPSAVTPALLSMLVDPHAGITNTVTAGRIGRVYAPETGVSIVATNSYGYELRFYPAGVLEAAGSAGPTSAPSTVWQVSDPDAGTNQYQRLNIRQLTGGQTRSLTEYTWSTNNGQNSLTWRTGEGLREEQVTWDYPSVTGDVERVDTHLVRDATGTVVERIVRTYRDYLFGEKLIREQKGEEGQEITTAEYDYFNDPASPGRYGKVALKINADGSWTRYDYDIEGREVLEVTPWLDGAPDAPDSESVVSMTDYDCIDSREVPFLGDVTWRTKLRMVAGQWVSTIYRAQFSEGNVIVEIEEDAATAESAYGDPANRRTLRRQFDPSADLRLRYRNQSVTHPDGAEDAWEYRMGNYTVTNSAIGVFTEQAGGRFIRVTETLQANRQVPYQSVRTVSIWDALGRDVQTEKWVCIGSNLYERMDWHTISRDAFGHELVRRYANGLATETTWSCCGKESETKPDGQRETYVQDLLGRTTLTIKEDGPTNNIVYDVNGRVLQKTISGGDLSLSTSNRYDLAGRLVESWDAAQLSTTIEYGERTETVTRPGGATEITARLRDGKVKSVMGTGVTPMFYEYGIEPDGGQWTKTYTALSNSPVWNLVVQDRKGRILHVERPGFGETVLTNFFEYDDEGRLIRESRTAEPDRLYQYDERGERIRSGLDVNTNGVLDLASMDRIQEQRNDYVLSGSNWLQRQTTILYPFDNSANAFTTSVRRTQVGGSGCACEAGVVETVDARGNVSSFQTSVNPLLKQVTKTQTQSGIANAETTVISNGLLQTRTLPTGAQYRYLYDALSRQIGTVDPRTGTNYTVYLANGRVDFVEDAATNRTTFAYDSTTGRRISVTDAVTNTISSAYDLQGHATNTWGATYPVAYEYDAYGRVSAMKTWRDTNSAPDATRWFYDEATGLLTNKVYADNNGPSYEYDATGHLTKRIWARGVEAEYTYGTLGQLISIVYSDDTPDVAFTYDRQGRQLTVADALGTRTNVYDANALLEERMPDGEVLARSYDSLGRPSGISLNAGYGVAYAYSDVGWLAAITSSIYSVTTAVEYAYLPQSALVSGWTVLDRAGTNLPVVVSRSFEPHRDLIVSVVNTGSVGVISQYDYDNDPLGRRITRNDYTSGVVAANNVFGYNARSELDAANMGTNGFGYQYDAIGNRLTAGHNDLNNYYAANSLNQYSLITNASSSLQPLYDVDGNMTNQGSWVFVWDAENRLAEVRSNGTVRIQNMFDYMSRRVQKIAGTATNTFRYDGWNLIREDSDSTRYSYIWGPDLSGTLQGAGGVGGLVARTKHTMTGGSGTLISAFVFGADANGNITDAINQMNHANRYRYVYDPYGNLLSSLPPSARDFKFRFSSKYCDDETDLYYYGYRFYSPSLGRWINRDMIEELGGLNIYSFVVNRPIVLVDPWGLSYSRDWNSQWLIRQNFLEIFADVTGSNFNHVPRIWWEDISSSQTLSSKKDCGCIGGTRFTCTVTKEKEFMGQSYILIHQWKNITEAAARDARYWLVLEARIKQHEEGHADIVKSAVNAVGKKSHTKSKDDCINVMACAMADVEVEQWFDSIKNETDVQILGDQAIYEGQERNIMQAFYSELLEAYNSGKNSPPAPP